MSLRRLPPLAIAMALVAAALVATTWATSRTVGGALASAGEGHALAVMQAVRADLADLGGEPSPQELAEIASDHAAAGLEYIGLFDSRGVVVAQVGEPRGTPVAGTDRVQDRVQDRRREIRHVGNRVRIDTRLDFRRHARGPWLASIALEVRPVEADALRAASRRTFAIVGVAALTLLGVAIAVTRRELRVRTDQAQREREKRLASLGEMSAVLAHEIKNPLASLKGNAQLLAAMLPAGATDLPREAQLRAPAKAQRVVDEAVRLEKLVQDLLAFVRTGQLQRAPAVPAALAREAADAVTGEVHVDDRGAPPAWSLDAGRIREVLVNLVENAVAAGPPVLVRVAAEHGRLVFEVSDRGPGVPPEAREKVFEPFFTGKTRGTGLGLAIAKRMVELHGGTIAVHAAAGGGACFRIELPEA